MTSTASRTKFGIAMKNLRERALPDGKPASLVEICDLLEKAGVPISVAAWSSYERSTLPDEARLEAIMDRLKLPLPSDPEFREDKTRAQLWMLYAVERAVAALSKAGQMIACLAADSGSFFRMLSEGLGIPTLRFSTPNITVKELIRNHIETKEVLEVWVAARKTMVERGVAIDEVLSVAMHKPYVYFLRSQAQARGIATKLWERAKREDYTPQQRAAIYDNLSFRDAQYTVAGFAEVTSMQILGDGRCLRYVRDSATPDVTSPCYRLMTDPEAAARMFDDLRDCEQTAESIKTLLKVERPDPDAALVGNPYIRPQSNMRDLASQAGDEIISGFNPKRSMKKK